MLFVEVFGALLPVVRAVDGAGPGLFLGIVPVEASTAGDKAFVDLVVGVFRSRAVSFSVKHDRLVFFDAASVMAPVGVVVVVHLR